MNGYRSIGLVAVAMCAAAAVHAQPLPANHVECTGTNVSARYTQSGSGSLLTIQLRHTLFQSDGAGTRDEATVLGRLLTLTTNVVTDAYVDTATLLLPDVIVQGGQPLAFRTWLYQTRTTTSFGGAAAGVVQSNRSVAMTCTATAAAL